MSRSGVLAITTATFLGLTWVTFFLRGWVRMRLVKKVGMDDKWMVVAQILYTIFTTMTLLGTYYGFGKHTYTLSNEDKMLAFKYWWLGEITYTLAAVATKIAICLFLLRVVFQKVYKWIIYVTMAIGITYSLFFLLVVVFQCLPPSLYWEQYLGDGAQGHCSNPDLIIGTSIAYGVVCMATDFTIGIIPIFIVRHLQMNTRTKFAVTGVLAMATVASLATVIRFPYLPDFRKTSDFLWNSYGISLWSNIEPGLGIIAGNLATMRPLLQRVAANTTRITNSLRTRQSPNRATKKPADILHSNTALSVKRPAGAHVDHNGIQRRDTNFTFYKHGDSKDPEYGVHVWHSDSKEELVDINGDVELGGSIFQKSELIVREETIDSFHNSQKK